MSSRLDRAITAAGAIAAQISPVFPSEVEEKAKIRLAEALDATRRVRKRNEDGTVGYEDVPDMPIRTAVALKIIEFNVGKPVQRSANLTPDAPTPASSQDQLLGMLLENPEAAQTVLGKLGEAAEKLKVAQAKQVQPLPAVVVPSS